jgi:hypothetical protein
MVNRIFAIVGYVKFNDFFIQVMSPTRGSFNSYLNHRYF